jgi:hypothetical protein
MFASDLTRPGLLPRANYNIALGQTFKFLSKDPIRDGITFAYTYEIPVPMGFCTRTSDRTIRRSV